MRTAQDRFGREHLAAAFERLFADLALFAMTEGFTKIIVAGGETSGAVAAALGPAALAFGPEIAPGVPALTVMRDKPIGLVLKSGNFGGDDFLETALAMLSEGRKA